MVILRGIDELQSAQFESSPGNAVTIGNFDGVHLGHQVLIRSAIDQARDLGAGSRSVVFTFRPHPQQALRPEIHIPLLLTFDEKLKKISDLGVDMILEQPFSRDFSNFTPEVFVREVLARRLKTRRLVVGHDFRFGSGRSGSLENLQPLAEQMGIRLLVIDPQSFDGRVPSSSKIRSALLTADLAAARSQLGYSFFYEGVVVRGDGRGKKIGIPTANLRIENKLALPFGVYATRSRVGQKSVASVTNIGVRPTFITQELGSELPASVETHLFDHDEDIYGSRLHLEFVQKIREERKFDGVESLVRQIRQDIEKARQILSMP